MRFHLLSLSSFIGAVALLAACGGSQPAATTPAEPGATPAAEGTPGEGSADAWSDSMSTKLKGEFMKKHVVPEMSKVFQEFDAKKYGEFGCKTCHGADMKPKPVDALPELHMKGGKLVEADKMPEMVKFMHENVVPKMAELFGKPPYDPKTNSGFGCGGCHKMNMWAFLRAPGLRVMACRSGRAAGRGRSCRDRWGSRRRSAGARWG